MTHAIYNYRCYHADIIVVTFGVFQFKDDASYTSATRCVRCPVALRGFRYVPFVCVSRVSTYDTASNTLLPN